MLVYVCPKHSQNFNIKVVRYHFDQAFTKLSNPMTVHSRRLSYEQHNTAFPTRQTTVVHSRTRFTIVRTVLPRSLQESPISPQAVFLVAIVLAVAVSIA